MVVKSWLSNFINKLINNIVNTNIEEVSDMRNFDHAFEFTVKNEGGYVNHEYDIGKETYMGISRYYNARWDGWDIIDSQKNKDDFPNNLRHAYGLTESVKDYYEDHYWNNINGDNITNLSVAVKLFDMAVSLGVKKANEYIQESLFALGEDIVADGITGPVTINSLNKILQDRRNIVRIIDMLYAYHTMHYINLALRKPKQKVFIKGWVTRANHKFKLHIR